MVPSRYVLTFLGALWLIAILYGVLLHRDLPSEQLAVVKHQLPLLWFDMLLRTSGPLLPFLGFFLRWLGSTGLVRPAAHFVEAGCIYFGLTVARIIIYALHLTGVLLWVGKWLYWKSHHDGSRAHLVSDHMVLGASITAIMAVEVVLAMGDLKRALRLPGKLLNKASIFAALMLSSSICLATIGDMFYTARYFHGRMESIAAVLLGYILFQGPVSYWLYMSRH